MSNNNNQRESEYENENNDDENNDDDGENDPLLPLIKKGNNAANKGRRWRKSQTTSGTGAKVSAAAGNESAAESDASVGSAPILIASSAGDLRAARRELVLFHPTRYGVARPELAPLIGPFVLFAAGRIRDAEYAAAGVHLSPSPILVSPRLVCLWLHRVAPVQRFVQGSVAATTSHMFAHGIQASLVSSFEGPLPASALRGLAAADPRHAGEAGMSPDAQLETWLSHIRRAIGELQALESTDNIRTILGFLIRLLRGLTLREVNVSPNSCELVPNRSGAVDHCIQFFREMGNGLLGPLVPRDYNMLFQLLGGICAAFMSADEFRYISFPENMFRLSRPHMYLCSVRLLQQSGAVPVSLAGAATLAPNSTMGEPHAGMGAAAATSVSLVASAPPLRSTRTAAAAAASAPPQPPDRPLRFTTVAVTAHFTTALRELEGDGYHASPVSLKRILDMMYEDRWRSWAVFSMFPFKKFKQEALESVPPEKEIDDDIMETLNTLMDIISKKIKTELRRRAPAAYERALCRAIADQAATDMANSVGLHINRRHALRMVDPELGHRMAEAPLVSAAQYALGKREAAASSAARAALKDSSRSRNWTPKVIADCAGDIRAQVGPYWGDYISLEEDESLRDAVPIPIEELFELLRKVIDESIREEVPEANATAKRGRGSSLNGALKDKQKKFTTLYKVVIIIRDLFTLYELPINPDMIGMLERRGSLNNLEVGDIHGFQELATFFARWHRHRGSAHRARGIRITGGHLQVYQRFPVSPAQQFRAQQFPGYEILKLTRSGEVSRSAVAAAAASSSSSLSAGIPLGDYALGSATRAAIEAAAGSAGATSSSSFGAAAVPSEAGAGAGAGAATAPDSPATSLQLPLDDISIRILDSRGYSQRLFTYFTDGKSIYVMYNGVFFGMVFPNMEAAVTYVNGRIRENLETFIVELDRSAAEMVASRERDAAAMAAANRGGGHPSKKSKRSKRNGTRHTKHPKRIKMGRVLSRKLTGRNLYRSHRRPRPSATTAQRTTQRRSKSHK